VFFESYSTGMPVMRPMWVEFPDEDETFDMQDQWMVGSALLVKPVTASGQSSLSVYLAGKQPWYDVESHAVLQPGRRTVDAPLVSHCRTRHRCHCPCRCVCGLHYVCALVQSGCRVSVRSCTLVHRAPDVAHVIMPVGVVWRSDVRAPLRCVCATLQSKIPVYQRGGTIVPRQMRPRRCSDFMAADPYTLIVALDKKEEACGQLYLDDGNSFDYKCVASRCSASSPSLSLSPVPIPAHSLSKCA
jgi:hypothetical protein